MEEDFLTLLTSDAGVTAALGDRIRWGERPTGPLPAVDLNVISEVPSIDMEADSNLDMTRVQLDVYGATYASARLASRALRARLQTFTGTVGSTLFQGIFQDDVRSRREAGENQADDQFNIRLDYLVHHARI